MKRKLVLVVIAMMAVTSAEAYDNPAPTTPPGLTTNQQEHFWVEQRHEIERRDREDNERYRQEMEEQAEQFRMQEPSSSPYTPDYSWQD